MTEPDLVPPERSSQSRAIIVISAANGFKKSQLNEMIPKQGAHANGDVEKGQASAPERTEHQQERFHLMGPAYGTEYPSTIIHLKEAPTIVKSSETPSDQEAIEMEATKKLMSSYFDIVRKNIEDFIPKAIMHFLVNHTKRELHNVLIEKLYK